MGFNQFKDITDGEEFDVVIVGGGINGIGTYRELTLQGLKVMLVERNDFCSRASSAPSRMIHGGLRYLENAEFDLVRESLSERDRLLRNAPHLVRPLRTIVPIRTYFAGMINASLKFFKIERPTTERGAFMIKVGLWFYDVFTRKSKAVPTHSFYGRKNTLTMFPNMRTDIKCSAQYFDAWITSPERMAIELISESNQEQGAMYSFNYCSASFLGEGGVSLHDTISDESRTVKAKCIVNATGAWVDDFNSSVGVSSDYVMGTKGSHLIIDNAELHDELDGAMVFYENTENRVCILFPYMGKVLVGSTEIPVTDLSDVVCTDDETDYILESLNFVFPTLTVRKDQIVYKFSGVRPLAAASAETFGQIPRSHQLKMDGYGGVPVLSLVGGKWTTYRAFAEEAADLVLDKLKKNRTHHSHDIPIGGGKDFPKSEALRDNYVTKISDQYTVSLEIVKKLFNRYGTASEAIIGASKNVSFTPLVYAENYYKEEVTYLIEKEYVQSLLDVVKRRTNMALEGQVTNELLVEVALICKSSLNWNDDRLKQQLQQSTENLAHEHGCVVDEAGCLRLLENIN